MPCVNENSSSCACFCVLYFLIFYPLHERAVLHKLLDIMQAWKKTTRKQMKKARTSALRKPLLAIFFLLFTITAAVYDFPAQWNRLPVFDVPEHAFRLGLDLQGGTHLVYEADMSSIPDVDRTQALEGVRDVIERRVNAFGVSEPLVQTIDSGDSYRVIVELAGVSDVAEAISQIGETPVLEFKEPGQELERALTEEEQAELIRRLAEDRAGAADVLRRAQRGEDFAELVREKTIAKNEIFSTREDLPTEVVDGFVDGLVAENPIYGEIVKAIDKNATRPGRIVPEVVETPQGLNVVKFVEKKDSKEMLLSHILVCFEGKSNCQNPIPALDASLQINSLKEQATAENFAQLADDFSSDGGALGGGDLGWIVPGETVPAFELEAAQTPVGGISNVVETAFGYHLIYKRDERQTQTYDVQRVLLKLTNEFDIVPPTDDWKNTPLSGKHLETSSVQFDQTTGSPIVALNFNKEGGELFGELTGRLVGQPIAIFLDGTPISTPTVQQAIFGGQAIITGTGDLEQAKLLSQRLNAGALPVPVELLSQQTVGPTLGALSLQKSVVASLIGFAFVAAFMILFYRIPGVVSALALVLFAFLNLAAYRLFGVTITLSGIAGFVLSLGIAVDANVLILERFKEEFRAGRDIRGAVDEGFKRAWSAIRDGNITTLIAAAVLYWFSSSFIKGFALTLSIGVILSMFTAIVVTRIYLTNVITWKWLARPWLFGAKKN